MPGVIVMWLVKKIWPCALLLLLSACPQPITPPIMVVEPPSELEPQPSGSANAGIPNICGSSCFFGSTMQLLTNNTYLSNAIANAPDSVRSQPLIASYLELASFLRSEDDGSRSELINQSARAFSSQLKFKGIGAQQNDAHEYFSHLIDQFSEIDLPHSAHLARGFEVVTEVSDSWTDFGGGQKRQTLSAERAINLPMAPSFEAIHSAYTLEELLDIYRGPEAISDYNIGFGVKVNVLRRNELSALGPSLVFYGSNIDVYGSGLKTPFTLTLPLKLDMRPYLTAGFVGPANYNLLGVVMHSGDINGGHYIALVQDRINHEWYLYNDSIRIQKSAEEVKQIVSSDGQFEGFTFTLIFYEQISKTT